MALSSIRALFDRNKYQGLGSYPESSTALQSFKWFKSKRFIRLALLLVIITSLGWFGYSTIYINQSAHEQEAAHQLVNNPAEDNLGILNDENVLKQPQQYVVEDKRLQSAKCEIPHLGRPLVQYVLVIDAGSTGSRIHVYKFNYCNDAPELEEELFEKARGENIKGLSGYPDDPEAAAHSLDSLMQTALKAVPPSLYKCTPITVKATAGLRKIDEEKGNNILRAVEQHLRTNYPFPILKENGVVIMDGKDEGVFAW
ncbi:Guanosine-diphosphatase, partial [Spiromyces aspiralis]